MSMYKELSDTVSETEQRKIILRHMDNHSIQQVIEDNLPLTEQDSEQCQDVFQYKKVSPDYNISEIPIIWGVVTALVGPTIGLMADYGPAVTIGTLLGGLAIMLIGIKIDEKMQYLPKKTIPSPSIKKQAKYIDSVIEENFPKQLTRGPYR